MFDFGGSTRQRVTRLEENVAELRSDVGGVVSAIAAQGTKLDKIAEGLNSTGEQAARRAYAIRDEIRGERVSKDRDRSALIKDGLALVGAVSVIVGALCGPYLQKLNSTATASEDNTNKIAAVREVLAQQGAAVGRNGDSIEIAREKNRLQDEQLRQLQHDQAYLQGWMSARNGYPGR